MVNQIYILVLICNMKLCIKFFYVPLKDAFLSGSVMTCAQGTSVEQVYHQLFGKIPTDLFLQDYLNSRC